ncbi:hypothetical protein M153_5140001359 [Pseudoloma neurophilia]|uniref:Uncharacterized protein n=1 Tax=Pseudoloma neurophilia TaxID=146866 RepID=A0A0R0M495_9MICR|nr:hypothetical protein M153_5140001359 [Pseudoloma neurophilia]
MVGNIDTISQDQQVWPDRLIRLPRSSLSNSVGDPSYEPDVLLKFLKNKYRRSEKFTIGGFFRKLTPRRRRMVSDRARLTETIVNLMENRRLKMKRFGAREFYYY